MQYLKFAFALATAVAVCGTAADARPNVQLHLAAAIVGHDAKGNQTFTPIAADTQLKPGETIRYDVVATNAGTDPAIKLAPIGRIPAGTEYETGTASASGALGVEFSIDGGKSFTKVPMIKVDTPAGVVLKKADPATYTAIRWTVARPLASKNSVAYSYEVRIK